MENSPELPNFLAPSAPPWDKFPMRPIGVGTKVAHGIGAMALSAKDAAFINFVPFFYTQVAGLSGTLYGWAAFVGQLSDAITDPIVGTICDNTRSRWGRYHPFMIASIIPLVICFLLLFNPPEGWHGIALFLWLAGVAIALRTSLTIFVIPHMAFGAELSQDYEERSLIVSYRTLLGWLGGVAVPALALGFIFSRGADGSDGRLIASNYNLYAWASAVVVIVVILWTVFFTRKEIPHLPPAGERRKLKLLDPVRDVLSALRNRNFRRLFVVFLFIGATTGVVVTLGYYANTYFWEFSAPQVGLILSSSVIGVSLGFAILRPVASRFEKKHIFIGAMVVLVINGLWWYGARLIDILPPNGAPILFYLALLHQIILSCAVMMQQTISGSMVADIVDEHEVETGGRRDGVFFAALGFSAKIPTGLGQLVGGVLIDVLGLETGLQPGDVPEDVLWNLGLVTGPLVSLSLVVPIWLLIAYNLDRRRHAELRAILGRADLPAQPSA